MPATLVRYRIAAWILAGASFACGGREPTTPSSDVDPAPAGCAPFLATGGPASQWVYVDERGAIAYKALPAGDRILDFSHAGYGGGGVAIPTAPVVATVSPSGVDDTDAIQGAIDGVSARPLSAGLRGAVLLQAGRYTVTRTLRITASGVVLRGSGSGPGGTVLEAAGSPRQFFEVRGSGSWSTSGRTDIVDAYVPAGTRSFRVASTAGFAAGDTVLVERPVTSAWIRFMGMDRLLRDGAPQTWLNTSSWSRADRTLAAVSAETVTLDVPLSDSIDAQYLSPPGARLSKYTFPGRISQVGIEGLRVEAPPEAIAISQTTFRFLSVVAVMDGWVRDVVAQDFADGLSMDNTDKRITIERTTMTHTLRANTSSGSPADFAVMGTQVLLDRCASSNSPGVFYVVTQGLSTGPLVVLNFAGSAGSGIQPHQRWTTGVLIDNAVLSSSNIEFMNRGNAGSGHGWTVGWAVAWNSTAGSLLIQQPPGVQNWAIGCRGTPTSRAAPGTSSPVLPTGIIESLGAPVSPKSLYLAQLCARLGPEALRRIGY